jgi:hypothetical protein
LQQRSLAKNALFGNNNTDLEQYPLAITPSLETMMPLATMTPLATMMPLATITARQVLFTRFGVNYNHMPNAFRKGTLLVPAQSAGRRVRQRTVSTGGAVAVSVGAGDAEGGDDTSHQPQIDITELNVDLSKCDLLPTDDR